MNLRVVRDSSLALVVGLQKLFTSKSRIPRFLRLLSPNLSTQIKQARQFKLQALSVSYRDDFASTLDLNLTEQ